MNRFVNLVEILSEGEIVGLVNGANSIYLDRTPLVNADGTKNFTGVAFELHKGTPDQDYFKTNPSAETSFSVGSEVKASLAPIVKTISDVNATSVRLLFTVPGLGSHGPGGDAGWQIDWHVEVRPAGGSWTAVAGNTTGYNFFTAQQTYQLVANLPAGGYPWDIRVVRTTADGGTMVGPDGATYTFNGDLIWESYTEVIEAKLSYPNTAAVALTIDANAFGQSTLPARSYRVKGLKIDVPSNYNPVTRAYTGIWDGTFQTAWTNNPAWVLYDLIVNDRYGLGEYLTPDMVDKWALYQIAQYCDELVPNGYGGTEPRYTINTQIVNKQEAFKLIQSIAAVFRGMAFWSMSSIYASADMPDDPAKLYSNANVIHGEFNYSGTAIKARHSVALVTWYDPNDFYRPAVEVVIDDEMLKRYGWRELSLEAMGCTTRSLANRYGRWVLDTEKNASESVEFVAGWDSADVKPGDIISIADAHKAMVRAGGRIVSVSAPSITAPTAESITDGDDVVWSFGAYVGANGYQVLKNGVQAYAGVAVQITLDAAGVIWVKNGSNNWYKDAGSFWSAQGGPPTSFITLDAPFDPGVGETYQLLVELPDKSVATKAISSIQNIRTGALETAYQISNPVLDSGWQNFQSRSILPPSELSDFAQGDHIVVTFEVAAATNNGALDGAYIGYQKPGGRDYDFDGGQVQITFNGGQTSVTGLNGVTEIVSDPILLPYDPNRQLIISAYWSGTQVAAYGKNISPGAYYKLGDTNISISEPLTSFLVEGNCAFIKKIEVQQTLAGDFCNVTLSSAFATPPQVGAMWTITGTDIAPRQFRVMSRDEREGHLFHITGLLHDPTKYARIENGISFDPLPYYRPPSTIKAPTNLEFAESIYQQNGVWNNRLTVSWTPGDDFLATAYKITADTPAGFKDFGQVVQTSLAIDGAALGPWTFYVYAVGVTGLQSSALSGSHTVAGYGVGGPYVDELQVVGGGSTFSGQNCAIEWVNHWADTLATGESDTRYKDNVVRVYDIDTNTLVRTEYVVGHTYTYTFAKNTTDFNAAFGQPPKRKFRFEISVRTQDNTEYTVTKLAVENPVPEMVLPTVTVSLTQVFVTYQTPLDPDFTGAKVWIETNDTYDPLTTTPAYDGANQALSFPGDPDTTYYVRLGCYDSFNKTGLNICPPVPAYIQGVLVDTSVPAVPTGLALTTETTTNADGSLDYAINADWSDSPSSNFGYFDVQIAEDAGVLVWIGASTESSVYRWTGLKSNKLYHVKVRAISKAGYESAYCTEQTITTALKTAAPGAPTGLSITASLKSAFLAWTNPSDKDLSYIEVYRNTSNNSGTATKIGSSFGTAFSDTGLTTGTTYYYWLKAVNTSGVASSFSTGANVAPGTIATGDIGAGVVGTTHLADLAVNSTKIADNAVVTAKIAASAVDAGKIAAAAVDSTKLADNAVVTAKIAANAVDSGKIAANAVGSTQLADLAVSSGKIADNAVVTAKIAANAVDSGKIAAGAVGSTQIATGAVLQTKMAIAGRDLVVTGVHFTYSGNTLSWTAGTVDFIDDPGTGAVLKSVAITSGSVNWTSGTQYIYWVKDATSLSTSTTSPVTSNVVTFATYKGSNVLVVYYGTGMIDGTVIGPDSITSSQIAANAITANEIAANAVVAGKIAANAVTATEIAAGSITTTKIAANAVTANEIAAGSVVAGKIAANAVTATEIAAGAITAGKIAANAVTATEIAAGSITTAKIAAGAVTATEIAAGAVVAGKIAANAVTATEIAAGSITTAKLAAGAVTANEIAANTITASQIATNTITAAQIAADAITSSEIAAGAVVAGKIAANAVTATEIAAGSITTAKISAGAVTATELAAGSVLADKIQAGAVTASKLKVQGASIFKDSFFNDASVWQLDPGGWFFEDASGANAPASLGIPRGVTLNFTGTARKVVWTQLQSGLSPNEVYTLRVRGTNQNISEAINVGIQFYDVSGSWLDWEEMQFGPDVDPVTQELQFVVPAGAVFYDLYIEREAGGAWADYACIGNIELLKAATGALIVDGAIVANKIAAGAITADKIQAGTITGDRISTSTALPGTITIGVTGVQIGSLTDPASLVNSGSTKINPGQILISGATTLSDWRNGSDNTKIEGGSIAANTISANKLTIGQRGLTIAGLEFSWASNVVSWTAGSITYVDDAGAEQTVSIASGSTATWSTGTIYIAWQKGATSLVSGTSTYAVSTHVTLATYRGAGDLVANYGRTIIDGAKIVTGSITATQIAAGAITSTQLAANSVTAGKIAAGAVTADTIGAGTIAATGAIYVGGTTFELSAPNQNLVIKDTQGTPKTRVKIGKLGASSTDYGIEIYNSAGTLMLSSNGSTALSAISADIGTVTAGKLQSLDTKFVIDLDNKTLTISD